MVPLCLCLIIVYIYIYIVCSLVVVQVDSALHM